MRLTERCYAVTGLAHSSGFSVNAGFVVGDGETLVVDSGFNHLSAQTILGYARAAAPRNRIRYLINTELHADHVLGNSLFKEQGATILAHRGAVLEPSRVDELGQGINEEFAERYRIRAALGEGTLFFENTQVCNPDILIDEDRSLRLGGLQVEVLLTPGHTHTNLSVHVPDERLVYVGDLIYSRYLPTMRPSFFEGEGQWGHWMRSLGRIEALDLDVLVPGHGAVCEGARIDEEISRHRRYLENKMAGKQAWWGIE